MTKKLTKFEAEHIVSAMLAEQPELLDAVISGTMSGMRSALDKAKQRAGMLDLAWRTALLVVTADRLSPGLKKILARSLLPVLEMNCPPAKWSGAERDADKKLREIGDI